MSATFGHPVSEETKRKISGAQKGVPRGSSWNKGTRCNRECVCESCGVAFSRYSRANGTFRFCSQACAYKERRQEQHPGWKGGRSVLPSGYIRVNIGAGRWQYEHILIAEKALGRSLRSSECVHHLNGIKGDNRNTNLLIYTNAYHRSLERRMAYLYQREHFA